VSRRASWTIAGNAPMTGYRYRHLNLLTGIATGCLARLLAYREYASRFSEADEVCFNDPLVGI